MLSKENRCLARWDPDELLVNLPFYITVQERLQFEVRKSAFITIKIIPKMPRFTFFSVHSIY